MSVEGEKAKMEDPDIEIIAVINKSQPSKSTDDKATVTPVKAKKPDADITVKPEDAKPSSSKTIVSSTSKTPKPDAKKTKPRIPLLPLCGHPGAPSACTSNFKTLTEDRIKHIVISKTVTCRHPIAQEHVRSQLHWCTCKNIVIFKDPLSEPTPTRRRPKPKRAGTRKDRPQKDN